MAWRVSAPLLVALVAAGCVDDIRTEGEVPAVHGATQPPTNGQSISADEACTRLEDAENDARKDLDCEPGGFPACPERLRLAGSLVCSEVDEGSVDECVQAMKDITTCEELASQPCVVTVVRNTCVNPYEAGVAPPPGEAGPPPDGSVDGGSPDSSVPPPSEGGPPPDPSDAGPVVTDAPAG
jgi:hypothetical protein